VLYNPDVLIVPALNELPDGPPTDHVTLPVTPEGSAALNCTWLPMIAVLGVTVIVGEVKAAVTVMLAFIVTLQVTVVADVHPDQEVKVWDPAVAGAEIVTAAPAL
jgi:hypothetical protein